MPSPPTTDLPRPRSWDEFEDICADVLKRLWKYPYVVRNGRLFQRQHGVDIYGHAEHLGGPGSRKFAGAQCKRSGDLTVATVEEEVMTAEEFQPALSEYLVMTTAPRNAQLQQEVRTRVWPFHVHVMFWEDICLELSSYDDLLQKHFPGWMRRTTTMEQVRNMVLSSKPQDFDYNERTDVYVHTGDVKLRIILDRGRAQIDEPWLAKFPDPEATTLSVYIYYGETQVDEVQCVHVRREGLIIPRPTVGPPLKIPFFGYHVGYIVNYPLTGDSFEVAVQQVGITVE